MTGQPVKRQEMWQASGLPVLSMSTHWKRHNIAYCMTDIHSLPSQQTSRQIIKLLWNKPIGVIVYNTVCANIEITTCQYNERLGKLVSTRFDQFWPGDRQHKCTSTHEYTEYELTKCIDEMKFKHLKKKQLIMVKYCCKTQYMCTICTVF